MIAFEGHCERVCTIHLCVEFAFARVPRPQVDTLKVGWCKIGEGDGAKALADLLMFNQTLSTVDLRGNILVRPPSGTRAAPCYCAVLAVTEDVHAGCSSTLRAALHALHLAPAVWDVLQSARPTKSTLFGPRRVTRAASSWPGR